jgi:hypothetical protein
MNTKQLIKQFAALGVSLGDLKAEYLNQSLPYGEWLETKKAYIESIERFNTV